VDRRHPEAHDAEVGVAAVRVGVEPVGKRRRDESGATGQWAKRTSAQRIDKSARMGGGRVARRSGLLVAHSQSPASRRYASTYGWRSGNGGSKTRRSLCWSSGANRSPRGRTTTPFAR
jgi:hypothetical protein